MLDRFPEEERKATLTLLLQTITNTVSEFHLCLESTSARRRATGAVTREEKLEHLRQYRAIIDELDRLYE